MSRAAVRLGALAALCAVGSAHSVASAQPHFVLEPSAQEPIATALRSADLPDGCKWLGANIDRDRVNTRYRCNGSELHIVLAHPDQSPETSARTRYFAVVDDAGAAPTLRDAILRSLRAHERGELWTVVGARTAPLARSRTWPFLAIAIVLTAGVTAALRFARGANESMPRQLARGAALLAATFLLGALLAAGWQHESCSLLWLLLPLGALGALVGAHRLSPWDARIALGLGALALVPRLVCEHLPANFYTDLLGPDGIDVHLRRPGGYAGFYRMLSGLFPVGPATIFGASVLSSTLAVVLAALALRDGGVCRHLPRHTWVLWGLLLAFDPLLAAIGASDASHNVALLAFGLTLFYHRDAAENGAHPLHLVALVVFAALVGLTRPEMIHTPLVCLLLVAGDAGSRRRLAWPALATVAGVALSVWFWSGQDLGAVVRPIDASSLNARTLGQLAGLTNVYPARGPTSGLDVQHALFAGLSVVLVAFAIVERRWSLLAIPVSYFFVGLPRLATDFHSDHQIGSNMATARYSLVPMALLLLLAAGGAGASWMLLSRAAEALGASRRIRVAGGTALIGLAVLAWIGHGAITGRLYASQHLPYREEYRLLARALPHLPQGSRIAVHYAAHFPSRRHDPDTSLGVPHALLAFLRPDVRFVVLGPLDDPPACERCYYFVGAMCNLDIAHVRADATPEDSAFLASLQSACDRGRALVSAPVARAEHASDVIFWRLKENRVRLLLGPTADTRQHGGSTESAP